MYKQESEEPKVTIGKLSAKSVSDLVQAESGIRISDRTMQQAIKDNKAGLSPRKPGRPGYFLELVFDHMAFETYIKKLIPWVRHSQERIDLLPAAKYHGQIFHMPLKERRVIAKIHSCLSRRM